MRKDEPAEFRILRLQPDRQTQTIWTCAEHAGMTLRTLIGSTVLFVGKANPEIHRCKGCDADWPVKLCPD